MRPAALLLAGLAAIGSVALFAGGADAQADANERAESPSGLALPPGRLADAVRALDPHTAPHAPPVDATDPARRDAFGQPGRVPAAPKDAWSDPATWSAWSDLVSREARARPNADPERRARLALLALEQKRFADAWAHLEAIAPAAAGSALGDPDAGSRALREAWIAALLPRFLPGVPRGSTAGAGGLPGLLPDGVVLAPAVPPASAGATAGPWARRVDRRAMSTSAVHVGAAVISLRIAVEAEGVQIDVHHVSGGAAKLSIVIPGVEEFSFANEYVDWYRQDELGVPHALEVKPGDEDHVLYGRFEPRPPRAPTRIPSALPAQLASGSLWLRVPALGTAAAGEESKSRRALFESIARALSAPGIRCTLAEPAQELAGWTGISVDLTDPAERASKLAWLVSAVERFMLVPPAASRR